MVLLATVIDSKKTTKDINTKGFAVRPPFYDPKTGRLEEYNIDRKRCYKYNQKKGDGKEVNCDKKDVCNPNRKLAGCDDEGVTLYLECWTCVREANAEELPLVVDEVSKQAKKQAKKETKKEAKKEAKKQEKKEAKAAAEAAAKKAAAKAAKKAAKKKKKANRRKKKSKST